MRCSMMQQASSPTPRLLQSPSSPRAIFLVAAAAASSSNLHDLHTIPAIKLVGSSHSSSSNNSGNPSSSSSSASSSSSSASSASVSSRATNPSLLKRKRPPKICIPALELLNQQQEQLQQDDASQTQTGDCYAVFCKRGKRQIMEDTFTAVTNLNGNPNQAFYGVFDGHGGREAAQFAARNLLQNILDACPSKSCNPGAEEFRSGYSTTDCDFLRLGSSSGASCVTALITHNRLLVANAGDCRAVLVKSDGSAVQLTQDHRVSCAVERQRIERLGGVVDCFTGIWRVQGVLAVSRGIGDLHLKQFISCEPDILSFDLTSDCRFLILASDGLWDMVSNQEAVDCTFDVLRKASAEELLADTCKRLVDMALQRGCHDDITVIIVHFKQYANL